MLQDSTHPTGVTDESPRGNAEVARARDRKANAAIQLSIAGASWDEIATVVGYPTARQAKVAVERALEKELHTESSQKFLRALYGKRLDRLLRAVWGKAIDTEHPDQFVAVAEARRIIDRQARLTGADAPTEYVVTTPAQAELERWVSEVLKHKAPELEEADIFDVVEGEVVDEFTSEPEA